MSGPAQTAVAATRPGGGVMTGPGGSLRVRFCPQPEAQPEFCTGRICAGDDRGTVLRCSAYTPGQES